MENHVRNVFNSSVAVLLMGAGSSPSWQTSVTVFYSLDRMYVSCIEVTCVKELQLHTLDSVGNIEN